MRTLLDPNETRAMCCGTVMSGVSGPSKVGTANGPSAKGESDAGAHYIRPRPALSRSGQEARCHQTRFDIGSMRSKGATSR